MSNRVEEVFSHVQVRREWQRAHVLEPPQRKETHSACLARHELAALKDELQQLRALALPTPKPASALHERHALELFSRTAQVM